jgi:hypothetical protein
MAAQIEVPVSYGEAFDKLSILNIKAARICDSNKLAKVYIEKTLLESRLAALITQVRDEMQLLEYVNGLLWDVEDELRLLELRRDTESAKFRRHAREVYCLNDRRAEIKRQIDNKLSSTVQEVKSYAPYKGKKLLLLGHLGLGDIIIMNGLIRYKALFHEEVRLVVFAKYLDSVRFMFRDLVNITYEPVLCEADISPNYAMVIPQRLSDLVERDGYEYLPLGVHGRDAGWQSRAYDFAEAFYVQAGVPYDVRWSYGFILRDRAREEELYERIVRALGTSTYRIIHDDPERSLLINRDLCGSGAPLFHVATKEIGGAATWSSNIFDYALLIERAEEYHGMDSSFMLMLDLIRSKCSSINLHTYVKGDVHARLYNWIPVKFVGRTARNYKIRHATKEEATHLDIQGLRDEGFTHLVCGPATDKWLQPIIWSDYATVAQKADGSCVVFCLERYGSLPTTARSTWIDYR